MLFQASLRHRIEAAYENSGNWIGWRFLCSPAQVLDHADVAFLGLHPGGTHHQPDQDEFCMASGSAYEEEVWAGHPAGHSPLQLQVRALFSGLGVAADTVLAGNLVPFRSPDWASFRNKEAALALGEALWCDIFARARPKLVIAMGGLAQQRVRRILNVQVDASEPVNWGNVKGIHGSFDDGGVFVGLPHLSRFAIMRRAESAEPVRKLFGAFWRAERSV